MSLCVMKHPFSLEVNILAFIMVEKALGESYTRKVKIGIKILKSSPPPLIPLANPKEGGKINKVNNTSKPSQSS